jgi:MFS transporter, DHA1 family, multidrug resistance protein
MGALQMGFGAIASAVVGLISNGTTVPMTGVMAGCALLGLIILLIGRKRIEFKSRMEDVEAQAFEQIEKY